MLNHIIWHEGVYPEPSTRSHPVIIHRSHTFTRESSPPEDLRIMTPDLLDKLKNSVRQFAKTVVDVSVFSNPAEVNQLLGHNRLLGSQIIVEYTKAFDIER